MSNWQANQEEFALVRGMSNRGIPVDAYELERMKNACLGLEIFAGAAFPSTAFNLPAEGAGYVFNVMISNDSQQLLHLKHITFEGPEWESGMMRLLPDPHKEHPAQWCRNPRKDRNKDGAFLHHVAVRNSYEFPHGSSHRFERDAVLNHKIAPRYALYPGEFMEGLFLAAGDISIPSNYHDLDRFDVRLTVFDQRGHSSWRRLKVMVQRTPKEIQKIQLIQQLTEADEHHICTNRAAAAPRMRHQRTMVSDMETTAIIPDLAETVAAEELQPVG